MGHCGSGVYARGFRKKSKGRGTNLDKLEGNFGPLSLGDTQSTFPFRGRPFLVLGHTPSTARTFRKKLRKILERPRKHSQSFSWKLPREYGWDPTNPYTSRHLKAPEHFQNSLPPSTAGDASFFRSGSGEGLSEPVMEFPAVLGVCLRCAPPRQSQPLNERPTQQQSFSTGAK